MPFNNAHHFVMEGVALMEIGTQINNNNITNTVERRKSLSPVRNVPPSTSQNFTGQEEYLEKLHEHFDIHGYSVRKLYLLYGMGGIGKTQICLKFKDDVSDNYAHVFWIDATSDDTIEQSLKDIYKTHPASMPQGNSFSSALVLHWISILKDKWLIIYDNADGSPNVVQKFIPPGNKGHILISSRNPEHKRIVSPSNSTEVNVMEKNSAIQLLLKSAGLHGETERYFDPASEICTKLHFLPLAIDQAGAYINAGRCSIDKYISIYTKYSHKLMDNKSFRGASKYDKTVYGTWEISFENIQSMANDKDNEDQANAAQYAIKLLNMCAFMHHENISDEIFERAARHYNHYVDDYKDFPLPKYIPTMDTSILNLDESNGWNEMQYHESIGILVSFSLIKRTADATKFGLHPLVQKWCKDRLNIEEKQKWILSARGVLVASITKNETTAEYVYLNFLLLHIAQNLSHENLRTMTYYHDIFLLLQRTLYINGKYGAHHILSKRIFEMSHERFGDHNENTLESISILALSYWHMGNFTDAERLHTDIVRIRSQMFGTEHPATLTSMAKLAITYFRVENYIEAERACGEVLEIQERILGAEHPDTLRSMAEMALIYNTLGKYAEAERLGVRVFEMTRSCLGTENPDTLKSLEYLGNIYCECSKYIGAERIRLKILEIRKRILGAEHPDTLRDMENLAFIYSLIGKFAEAKTLEVQVLEMRRRILGTEHPDTLTSMANLADTYNILGRYADAERLEVQVLEMRKRILGTEHPDTLKSIANLAFTYHAMGSYTEAESLEEHVLEMRGRILGMEHQDTLESLATLATTRRKLRKYAEAERLEVQVLESRCRILGAEHADTLTSMENLAATYYELGEYSEAERLQVRVLEIRVRNMGVEDPSVLTIMDNLADTYYELGKYSETERLKVQVLETTVRTLGAEHPNTPISMINLANTYRRLGKYPEAEELELQLSTIKTHGK